MKDIFYTMALALGTILIIMAMTIVSIGYLWHLVHKDIEKIETTYYKALSDTNISN